MEKVVRDYSRAKFCRTALNFAELGKVLKALHERGEQVLDLEDAGKHRGSVSCADTQTGFTHA